MTILRIARCAIMLSVLALTFGCASAYHSYSGCRVPCRYCPPSPLPYQQYSECVCHSRSVDGYLMATPAPVPQSEGSTSNDEAMEGR